MIKLESTSIGSSFSGVDVDVLGEFKEVPLAVYCTYEGRDVPDLLFHPKISLSGAIGINLGCVAALLRQNKTGGYIDALRLFLEQSSDGKFWIYHPRYVAAKKKQN